MKRFLAWGLFVVFLFSLHACAKAPEMTPSPYDEEDFDTSGTVVLSIEHEVYDKSVESFNYYVENCGEETITFGAPYTIEVYRDGAWRSLPAAEDVGWNDIAYQVAPGETWGNSFSFFPYDYEVSDGYYRLIKEVGGRLYYAEFTIGVSDITSDTPYGYEELESLPEELDLSSMDYDLLISAAGTIIGGNEQRVASFLERVSLGTSAMLRIVCYTIEGDPVIHDIIYENSHFLYRRDATRDRLGGTEEIEERRYSFLVTDGTYIYLSDYATLSEDDMGGRNITAGRYAILPETWFSDWEAIRGAVEEMTEERVASNVTLVRFWSEDGTYWVNLTKDPMDYTVSSKGYGMSRTLDEWDDEEALEIVTARWESETRVRLLCLPVGGDFSSTELNRYAIFDVEAEEIVESGFALWTNSEEAFSQGELTDFTE